MATAVQDLSAPSVAIHARSTPRIVIAWAVALLALLIPLVHSFNPGEFAVDTDESFHAMTGVFFADFYADHPVTHPVEYTYRYYAKYPALGLIHWPPFFHMVEGVAFHIFGISAQTARLTVRLFVLLGLFYFFRLIEMLLDQRAAILGTLLLALMPGLVSLQSAVMIEWPALAMCVAASFYWLRWILAKSRMDLWAFAVFGALALFTKQQSFYLAVFCLMSLLAAREWRNKLLRKVILVIAAISVPFYWLAVAQHGRSIIDHIHGGRAFDHKAIFFYFAQLPSLLGWWILPFVLFGMYWGLKNARNTAVLMLLWIAACFLSFTFLNAREPRYNIYCVPPLLYFALIPLSIACKNRWRSVVVSAVALALILVYTAQAWSTTAPFASGISAAAQKVLDANIPGRPVIFDGEMSGDFVFYIRALDPSRNSIVLRKSLYASNILRQFGAVQMVDDQDQLRKLIDDYGVHILVVAENDPYHFPIQRVLRQYLLTPRFRPIARIRIQSSDYRLQGKILQVYENLDTKTPVAQSLNLRMLTLDHDITVPIGDLAARP